MAQKGTMAMDEFIEAALDENDDFRPDGPRCATCDELAVVGLHKGCERGRGTLIVWLPEADSALDYRPKED